MGCHCFILHLCFLYTAMQHCPIQSASRTMMLIFWCPTFTFPRHCELLLQTCIFPAHLKMSPLLLPAAIFGLQNHRDVFCIADGTKKKRAGSYFQQLKIAHREQSHSANEFALAARGKKTKTEINRVVVSQSLLCGLPRSVC